MSTDSSIQMFRKILLVVFWSTLVAEVVYGGNRLRRDIVPTPLVTCQTPSVLPRCIGFYVNAFKLYPFLSQDSVLDMTRQDHPYQLQLPSVLPVVRGNSGNYMSTITIDGATLVSVAGNPASVGATSNQIQCEYKGTGIQNPQLPSEVAAAQNYAFLGCKPAEFGLMAGDRIMVRNGPSGGVVRVRVLDGGSQNNLDRVQIGLWLNETGVGVTCTNSDAPTYGLPACTTTWYTPTSVSTASETAAASSSASSSASGEPTAITSATDPAVETQSSSTESSSVATETSSGGNGGADSGSGSSNGGDRAGIPSAVLYAIIGGTVVLAVASVGFATLLVRRQRAHNAYLKSQGLFPTGSGKNVFMSKETVKLPSKLSEPSMNRDYDDVFQNDHHEAEDNMDAEDNLQVADPKCVEADTEEGRGRSKTANSALMKSAKALALDRRSTAAELRDRVRSAPMDLSLGNQRSQVLEQTLLNTQAGLAIPGFLMINFSNDLRLEKTIAEGGGGVIYQAEMLDESLRRKYRVRRVAAKVMKMSEGWSQEERATVFRQEVAIMWALAFHRNIVKLIGFCEDPYCIVTKMYGQNLSTVILDKEHFELFPELTTSFALDICSGMTEMHSLGIAHRDLKTSNCLIEKLRTLPNPTYNVVLCDFGLSRVDTDIVSAVKGWKQSVVTGISVRYAAPEVFTRLRVPVNQPGTNRHSGAQSQSKSLQDVLSERNGLSAGAFSTVEEDKAADVYAYGVILWELLERETPWDGLDNDEVEFQVRRGKRPHVKKNKDVNGFEEAIQEEEDYEDEAADPKSGIDDTQAKPRNHTRQSTARTAATSLITSFKRFTFTGRAQAAFEPESFLRTNMVEIMHVAWDTEPYLRPKFSDIKPRLILMLETLKTNTKQP